MSSYLERDVRTSWRWLGHRAYTELVALHPAYRPGREHYAHNKEHNAFPRTSYAKSEREVVGFLRKHHGERMVCYGINERAEAYKNDRGYPRAAREEEIEHAKSMFIDLDVKARQPTRAHREALESFLGEAEDYFQDLGLRPPVRAFTGRGYHLLFAYPEILVEECPDLSIRQRKFVEDFADDYHKELANLETRVDSTQDLRRMVKIYGTAKPNVGITSRFYGEERVEDDELRRYLLSMPVDAPANENSRVKPAFGPELVTIDDRLPRLFVNLLRQDEKLRALWEGKGKPDGSDTSGSGYDFSLARRLLVYGFTDVNDIATVLALRPEGSYQKTNKSEDYLRRTIANALRS